MSILCGWCGRAVTNGNAKYCDRRCGNQAKSHRSVELAVIEARQFVDRAVNHGEWFELPMRTGGSVKVDAIDLNYVGDWCWMIGTTGYAMRSVLKPTAPSGKGMVRMHRSIVERVLGRSLGQHELVDHINHDTLDNRRSNLRLCNLSQNTQNMTKSRGGSQYLGVCWDKERGKWKAEIRFDGVRTQVGRFDDEAEAAWYRDQWAIALHGNFASLNFDYVEVA